MLHSLIGYYHTCFAEGKLLPEKAAMIILTSGKEE